jgi:hypothetical protein
METPWGTTQQFNLHDSINTNFLDEDIQPISGRQRPLIFDGIDARDGLTNYRSTQEVNSSNIYTYYTKSGKKISLTQNGANSVTPDQPWRYNVLVDGVAVGQIGQRTVLDRWQVPGYNFDVAVSASGTILALGRDGDLREYNATTHALINSKASHIKATDVETNDTAWAIIVRGPATTYTDYLIIWFKISTQAVTVRDAVSSNTVAVLGAAGDRLQNSWAWQNSNASQNNFIFWCPNDNVNPNSFESRYGNIATAGPWTALGADTSNMGVPAVNKTGANRWSHMVMGLAVGTEEFCRVIIMDDAGLISNTATVYPGTTPVGVTKSIAPGCLSATWTTAAPDVRAGMLFGEADIRTLTVGNLSTLYTPDTMTRIPGYIGTATKGKSFLPIMNGGKIFSYHLADYGESLTQQGSASNGVQNGQAMINYGDTVSDYSPSFHTFTANAPNYRLANNFYNLFVHKQSPGAFCVTRIGNARPTNIAVSEFIHEIAPDVVAFECDTSHGIFDCQDQKWYMKGQHFGIVFFSPGSASGVSTRVNFQNRSQFSETIAFGDKTVLITSSVLLPFITPWDLRDGDVFLDSNYFKTITSYTTLTTGVVISANFNLGTAFLSSTYTPLAIRQRQNPISALWFDETELTIPGSDGFFSENILTGRFQVFNINGQTYLYDGSGISQVFFNGLLFSGKQIVNNTKNLRFLTVSREIAFFLSDFNQAMFGFDGARSMQHVEAFLAFSTIREAWYTSNDDTLWLTDGAKLITWREGKWGAVTYANASGSLMMDTTAGSYIVKEDGQTVNTWSLLTGTILPMTLKTPFVGLGDNNRIKVRMYSIYLKFDTITNTNITLTYRYLLENGLNSAPAVIFNVLSTMMDANGYVRLWYEAPVDTTIGASLEITCASKYWIVELIPYFGVEAVSIPVGAQIIS